MSWFRRAVLRWLGVHQLYEAFVTNARNIEQLRLAIIGLGNATWKIADNQEKMMQNLDAYNAVVAELTARVASLKTVEDSAIALINGLRAQINDLITRTDGIVPVEELQKLSSAIDVGTKSLADAVANSQNVTPAAPPPAPEPVPAPAADPVPSDPAAVTEPAPAAPSTGS